MEDRKAQLIQDIEALLNGYEGMAPTHLNPDVLACLDEAGLKSIIDSLLKQKEKTVESNLEWLETFKKY